MSLPIESNIAKPRQVNDILDMFPDASAEICPADSVEAGSA
jgi:hypothetical protein